MSYNYFRFKLFSPSDMNKLLLVLFFIGISQVSSSWLGSWVTRNSTTNNIALCPVTAQLTNSTISAKDKSSLVLTGILSGTSTLKQWNLPWGPDAGSSNSCDNFWCINATISGDSANISYTGISIYTGVKCTISLNRPVWLGQWYVISSYTNNAGSCFAPKLYTNVWNSYSNGQLLTYGISTYTNFNISYTQNWNPFARNASATYNGAAQTGAIMMFNGNATGIVSITTSSCQSGWTITRYPDEPARNVYVTAAVEEDSLEFSSDLY